MNSKLQEALQDGTETLETLATRYALKAKRHGEYPHLVQLKYDQINSPMDNPLVQEARGIILDESDNWRIIARPFNKFFNMGESLAANIDWNTARVQEKLDGSLMIVYHYDNKWHVASSGTPDASGNVGSATITFKDLFWSVWDELHYDIDDEAGLDREFTYMFELCTKFNRVVVSHPTERLVLIGVRNTLTGEEFPATKEWFGNDFEVVKAFPIKTEADVVASFEAFDGLQQEGYVVVDSKFNRIKVKHPRYVLFHHMLGSLTPKKLLEAIRTGELPEILAYFPEWAAEADRLEARYKQLIASAIWAYTQIRDIPVQKDFAIEALKSPHKSAMFAVRSGKAKDFTDYYRTLRLETLADMIGIKETQSEEQTHE